MNYHRFSSDLGFNSLNPCWRGGMVYTQDLKSCAPDRACGFESHRQYSPHLSCDPASLSGQCDPRRFMVAPKQRRNMPNPLDQRRAGGRADLGNQPVASFPIRGIDPDLNQFVVIKSLNNFVQDGRGHAVITDNDDRLAGMGQGFEMALLRIVEIEHEGETGSW